MSKHGVDFRALKDANFSEHYERSEYLIDRATITKNL